MLFLRRLGAYVVACIAFIVLGIGSATQFVVANLADMGVEVSLGTRLGMTLHDIWTMAFVPMPGLGIPPFSVIFAIALLLGLLVAGMLIRTVRVCSAVLFAVAGFTSFAVALWMIEMVFNLTIVASTRSPTGFLVLCLAGAIAGYLYNLLMMPRRYHHRL